MNRAPVIDSLKVRKWTSPSLVIVATRFIRMWGLGTSI
jgi:hypothetical protein